MHCCNSQVLLATYSNIKNKKGMQVLSADITIMTLYSEFLLNTHKSSFLVISALHKGFWFI